MKPVGWPACVEAQVKLCPTIWLEHRVPPCQAQRRTFRYERWLETDIILPYFFRYLLVILCSCLKNSIYIYINTYIYSNCYWSCFFNESAVIFWGPGGRWTVAMSWAAFIDTMATSSNEALQAVGWWSSRRGERDSQTVVNNDTAWLFIICCWSRLSLHCRNCKDYGFEVWACFLASCP